MLPAPQIRKISSTTKDGPEITLPSDMRLMERIRTPPRGIGMSIFWLSTFKSDLGAEECITGAPNVRSNPFRVPPRKPPAAVCDGASVFELWSAV